MGVSTAKMIQKMEHEITHVKDAQLKTDKMKHIANIKLLCELLLDEDTIEEKPQKEAISNKELEVMLGRTKKNMVKKNDPGHDGIQHGGANGESLFDF